MLKVSIGCVPFLILGAFLCLFTGCGLDYESELIVNKVSGKSSRYNDQFKYTFDETTIISPKKFTIGDTLELVKKGSCSLPK